MIKNSIKDFTDFAKSKGVDFTAMAKKYQGFRPADRDIKDQGVTEAKFTSQFKTKQEANSFINDN